MSDVSAVKLAELFQAGASIDLVDVRTPTEYRKVHVEFARNVPLDQLDPTTVMRHAPARPTRRCIWFATPGPAVGRRMNASSRQASPTWSMSKGGPWLAWQRDCLSFVGRIRSR